MNWRPIRGWTKPLHERGMKAGSMPERLLIGPGSPPSIDPVYPELSPPPEPCPKTSPLDLRIVQVSRKGQIQSFQVPGLADEVGSDGHRLPPYNDLWGTPHYRGGPYPKDEFYPHRPAGPPLRPVIIQDHLKLGDHGPKCRASLLFTLLLYAAARITSLSDACKALRDAPSDEAVRLALIATLPDFAELQSPAQRRLGQQLAQDLASQPAAYGRRSGPDPLSWPAAARPRRDLPLRGQEPDQPLPRLRRAVSSATVTTSQSH